MKKKVAAIVTEYTHWSHADVIVGKILEGYNHDGKAGPSMRTRLAVRRSDADERLEPAPGQEVRLHDLRHASTRR